MIGLSVGMGAILIFQFMNYLLNYEIIIQTIMIFAFSFKVP